ncbi:hypothetical protein ACFW1A_05085 [Kitasatospora sp. NPDC058965]|uniref:hypothetical protein n=1 Tax=Kitasatospora sp. NPDC058965 TaxID=3346682 RepID=UPI0036B0D212
MSAYGIVTVTRTLDFSGSALPFRVLVDGALVGKVRIGGSVELPVTPGVHRVRLAQTLFASAPLTLQVEPGGRHHLIAGISRGLRVFVPSRALLLVARADPAA